MKSQKEHKKAIWKSIGFLVAALAALGVVIAGAVTGIEWMRWTGFGLCWIIVIISVRNLYLIIREVNKG